MNGQFHSPTIGALSKERVIGEVLSFIDQESKERYEIIIGTDSEGNGKADFVTAMILYRVGKGGRYFWTRTCRTNINSLRHKIQEEATLSLILAQEVLGELRKHWGEAVPSNCDLQIHVDVGRNGPTRDMIKEVVGMVRGNGFNVKTKPESFGASCVADRHV